MQGIFDLMLCEEWHMTEGCLSFRFQYDLEGDDFQEGHELWYMRPVNPTNNVNENQCCIIENGKQDLRFDSCGHGAFFVCVDGKSLPH